MSQKDYNIKLIIMDKIIMGGAYLMYKLGIKIQKKKIRQTENLVDLGDPKLGHPFDKILLVIVIIGSGLSAFSTYHVLKEVGLMISLFCVAIVASPRLKIWKRTSE